MVWRSWLLVVACRGWRVSFAPAGSCFKVGCLLIWLDWWENLQVDDSKSVLSPAESFAGSSEVSYFVSKES